MESLIEFAASIAVWLVLIWGVLLFLAWRWPVPFRPILRLFTRTLALLIYRPIEWLFSKASSQSKEGTVPRRGDWWDRSD